MADQAMVQLPAESILLTAQRQGVVGAVKKSRKSKYSLGLQLVFVIFDHRESGSVHRWRT
ncbi:hypothetical protein N0K08_17280 [Acidovorax sp. Be4]|uniref:Uncharacterized protein n=1 Tax=Acidovorax bellezanensis TaxID=2976702 RepID=A0ABT2PPL5_9BURK|nr:hypothetical protein [Acidovorax sp. Be4]MCT9812398.1 hypothetical protein [Acidovorax sp. Be4]